MISRNCTHEGPCLIYKGTSDCDMEILNELFEEYGYGTYLINGKEYDVIPGKQIGNTGYLNPEYNKPKQ